MERWEYKTIKVKATGFIGGEVETEDIEAKLNNLGRDGWELVSSFPTAASNGYTRYVLFVFKRKSTM